MVAETNAGRQAGRNTSHGCRSHATERERLDAPPLKVNSIVPNPDFSQGDGGLSGDCQNPEPDQAFTRSLRFRYRKSVVVACARAVPARVGKMLNWLANYGTRGAARGWW